MGFFQNAIARALELRDERGFYWSTNSPYLKDIWVTVRRIPRQWYRSKSQIGGLDANPAHIIHECLTHTDWGMQLPAAKLDLDSFKAAADTLFSESFGMSIMWVQQATIEDFINGVLNHIAATLSPNPLTGKLRLKLLRNDYDIDNLPELNLSNCSVDNIQRRSTAEVVNEIVLSWTNPDNEETETISVHDNANISAQGAIVSSPKEFPGIRNPALAARVAMRELKTSVTPLLGANVKAKRQFAYLMPGDVVKFSRPDLGFTDVVMRVGEVSYGKPSAMPVQLTLLEDVYSSCMGSYFIPQQSLWRSGDEAPLPMGYTLVLSAPFVLLAAWKGEDVAAALAPENEYVILAGATDQASCSGYELAVEGADEFGTPGYFSLGNFSPSLYALLGAGLSVESASTLTVGAVVGVRTVLAGDLLVIGGGTTLTDGRYLAEVLEATGPVAQDPGGFTVPVSAIDIYGHYLAADATWPMHCLAPYLSEYAGSAPRLDAALSAINASLIVISGGGKAIRSDDLGATWGPQKTTGLTTAVYAATVTLDGSLIIAVAYNGKIGVSSNGGVDWTLPTTPFGTTAVQLVAMDSGGAFAIAAGSTKLARSTDQGSTWGSLVSNPFGGVNITSVAISDDGAIAVLGSNDGRVAISTDGGATWGSAVQIGDTSPVKSLSASGDGQYLLMGRGNGKIYTSSNGGSTWQLSADTPFGTSSISKTLISSDGSFALALSGSSCSRSTDFGATWTVSATIPGVNSVYGAAICRSGDHVLVSSGAGAVVLTSDFGLSWETLNTGFSSVTIYAVALTRDPVLSIELVDGEYLQGGAKIRPEQAAESLAASGLPAWALPLDRLTCTACQPPAELCQVLQYDSGGHTILRGLFDTVPQSWPAGTPIWIFGTANQPARDQTARVAGETAKYKMLTNTALGQLPFDDAPVLSYDVDARQALPYRPAGLRVNGVLWPQGSVSPIVEISWATRNRLTEINQAMSWEDAGTASELGVTTTCRVDVLYPSGWVRDAYIATDIAGSSVTIPDNVMNRAVALNIKITAERDLLESYQIAQAYVETSALMASVHVTPAVFGTVYGTDENLVDLRASASAAGTLSTTISLKASRTVTAKVLKASLRTEISLAGTAYVTGSSSGFMLFEDELAADPMRSTASASATLYLVDETPASASVEANSVGTLSTGILAQASVTASVTATANVTMDRELAGSATIAASVTATAQDLAGDLVIISSATGSI